MPAYHVERSIRMDANEAKVRPAIEDFNNWPHWSPWLCMEPNASLHVFGSPGQVGHGYEWDGQLVGSGNMRIATVEPNRQRMELHFLKPFKSQAKVAIEITSDGPDQTLVTWHMDGNLPFFLFFMRGMMKTMIGMDYARGLKMLKEYVETGTVKSKTEVVGIVDVPQSHFIGVDDHCTMDGIGESMQRTLPAAQRFVEENQLEVCGPPGAVYHRVDLKHQQCHYTAIVPTSRGVQIEGAECGQIAPCRALKIIHTGSYDHLGNAWTTAMAYQRYKKIKPLKSQPPFERYPSDPDNTAAEDLVTEIFVPVRD